LPPCSIAISIHVLSVNQNSHDSWVRCGYDCMAVGFTTTYAISAYNH